MRHAITTTDGGVWIMNGVEGTVYDPQAEIAKWPSEQQAQVTSVAEVIDTPVERTFREAWEFDPPTETVVVNMAKAKNVWRDKMRVARQPLLDQLDRLWMRATARGEASEAAAIEAAREALRNVTQDLRIEAATTPAGLKAVWPDILGPRP